MANLEEILEQNKEQLGDLVNNKESFTALTGKLSELGYDVLLNHKEKAEFIPSSRLNEVVSQRDNFKNKIEELNSTLASVQKSAGDNEALKTQMQELMDNNNALLQELEDTRINSEIMAYAKDAINAKDVLAFIDKRNIKVNNKGEVLGVESEIARLKEEKPYLFNVNNPSKGGMSHNDDKQKGTHANSGMNSLLRRAAGII